jgi:signal transduction histidine kinase
LIKYEGEMAILGIMTDISERKKAEETLNRTMNELLRANEKLGVVGSLTRHDVRNKLSVISGNIFLLKKKHSDCEDIMFRLSAMEQAYKSIGKIFDFAKMYEQMGVEEQSFIAVEKTIDEAVALFSGSLNVQVINECRGLTVLADSFLRQLYYNLIDNSIKHGKKVTKIRMRYERADQDKLNLIYEDDGVGISFQNKPLLFKEGFSTGDSSGYGLYLIRKMMEVYGWVIQENGEPGIGVKFVITIPKVSLNGKENFQITKPDEPVCS